MIPDAGHLPHVERAGAVAGRCRASWKLRGISAMKVMSFHLMPYADLDFNVKDKYARSGSCCPTATTTRGRCTALYNRYLDELGSAPTWLRRHLRQRAPPECLRPDAVACRDGVGAARRTRDCRIAIWATRFCLREHPDAGRGAAMSTSSPAGG